MTDKNQDQQQKDAPEDDKGCMSRVKFHPLVLPSFVALLVIVLAATTIALLATNTNKAVDTVVDSLQDQVLTLAETSFEQQLSTLLVANENLAKEISRTGVPYVSNSTPLYANGYQGVARAMDKVVSDIDTVDLAYMFIRNEGRALLLSKRNETHNTYMEEFWPNGVQTWRYPEYDMNWLTNLDYTYSGSFYSPASNFSYQGYTRPFSYLNDRSIHLDYSWIGPYNLDTSTYFTIVHNMNVGGTYLGTVCIDALLDNFQANFTERIQPTPRSVTFVVDASNDRLVVTTKGRILTTDFKRIKIQESNTSVLREAGLKIGDWGNVKSLTRAQFKANDGEKWLLSAKPFTNFRTNFVLAVATPDDEFSGSVDKATTNTIIICVVITIVVFAIIIFLSIQQLRLVEGSRQSVILAQDVGGHLIMYDTDAAANTLSNAKNNKTFIDEETGFESPNYVSKALIKTLQQIVENLMLYKPHLPDYVLPSNREPSSVLGLNDMDHDMEEDETDHDMRSSRNSLPARNSKNNRSKDPQGSGKQQNARRKSDYQNAGGDMAAMDPTNPFYVDMKAANQSADNTTARTRNSNSTAGGGHRNQIAKVAMLRDSGSYVERVVLCNLNLSRIPDILFPLSKGVKANSIRYINRVIELILDNATNNDASVHSLVGDSLQASWNGTQRTAHADVKACRFVTATEIALKKEISEWLKDPAAQQGVVPVFNTHKALLTGALTHGNAFCQLGGSAKKQQFMLLNFSETNALKSSFELGVRRRIIAVCRTINQNVQHEFLLRGAGIDILPGAHIALFGQPSTGNLGQLADYTTHSSVQGSADGDQATPDGSADGENGAPKLQNDGKTLLALPLYELVSRKKLLNEDEWLYVVGDGKETSKTIVNQICGVFNEVVMDICRGNASRASEGLSKARTIDAECQQLNAYKSLEDLISRLSK